MRGCGSLLHERYYVTLNPVNRGWIVSELHLEFGLKIANSSPDNRPDSTLTRNIYQIADSYRFSHVLPQSSSR